MALQPFPTAFADPGHHRFASCLYCCYCSVTKLCLFATLWTVALSFIISWSLLRLTSIESMMPSSHQPCVSTVLPFLDLSLSLMRPVFPFSERHMLDSTSEHQKSNRNPQNALPNLAIHTPCMARVSLDLGSKFFCLSAEVLIVTSMTYQGNLFILPQLISQGHGCGT